MALAASGAPLQEDKLAVPASQASLWGPMDTRVKVGGAAASHWTTECPGHPWSCFPPAGFAQGNKAPHTNKQWPLLWLHRKHIEPCRHYTAVELSVQRMGHILIGHSWRRSYDTQQCMGWLGPRLTAAAGQWLQRWSTKANYLVAAADRIKTQHICQHYSSLLRLMS